MGVVKAIFGGVTIEGPADEVAFCMFLVLTYEQVYREQIASKQELDEAFKAVVASLNRKPDNR